MGDTGKTCTAEFIMPKPASVLFDKIRQEKERLIKEKKIKRDKNASIIYRGEDNSYYEKFASPCGEYLLIIGTHRTNPCPFIRTT